MWFWNHLEYCVPEVPKNPKCFLRYSRLEITWFFRISSSLRMLQKFRCGSFKNNSLWFRMILWFWNWTRSLLSTKLLLVQISWRHNWILGRCCRILNYSISAVKKFLPKLWPAQEPFVLKWNFIDNFVHDFLNEKDWFKKNQKF